MTESRKYAKSCGHCAENREVKVGLPRAEIWGRRPDPTQVISRLYDRGRIKQATCGSPSYQLRRRGVEGGEGCSHIPSSSEANLNLVMEMASLTRARGNEECGGDVSQYIDFKVRIIYGGRLQEWFGF